MSLQLDKYDSLEVLLKEAADNFRMTPSPKIWKSIYHGIHPSRKWPSVQAFLLFFICFLIFSEYNNQVTANDSSVIATSHFSISKDIQSSSLASVPEKNFSNPYINASEKQHVANKTSLSFPKNSKVAIINDVEPGLTSMVPNIDSDEKLNTNLLHKNINQHPYNPTSDLFSDSKSHIHYSDTRENSQSRNFAYQIYAGSSYGFGNANRSTQTNGNETLTANEQLNNGQEQFIPEMNFEAGGAFLFPVSRYWKVKAGMQLNYSNYSVVADYQDQQGLSAISESIALSNESNRVSGFSDGSGKQRRFRYMVSIPLGTEFELAGNRQFKWKAGATLQPGYLMYGNMKGNTLSSQENQTLVHDPVKWNVNSSVETFLSYQLKNGASIIAGPQLRYQLYPLDNARLPFSDKFYQLGLKLGFSRNL